MIRVLPSILGTDTGADPVVATERIGLVQELDTMHSRERVSVALQHRQPDRVPKGFFGDPTFTAGLRRYFGAADDHGVLEALGVDLRHVEPLFVGPAERSGGLQFTNRAFPDFWGVPRKLVENEYGVYSEIASHPLAGAATVAEIEAYAWPQPEWFDMASIAEQLAVADRTEPRWINYHRAGKLFEAAWPLRGMEQMLIDLMTAPQMAEALFVKILEHYSGLARRVIQAAQGRIDMVTIGDDVGTQRGMMMAPELWRRTIRPYLAQLVRMFHDLGVKVMYHSCGAIVPIIEDLIEAGVDILEPIQSQAAGMAPAVLKRRFGTRLSFHGGVDEQDLLPRGSPADVRRDVAHLARTLGRGGGYILMADHAFQPDTPCENVVAMYEAVEA